MTIGIIDNVWNFSEILLNGFQATISWSDGNDDPLDFVGATAQMQLTRTIDNVLEFSWTTANGLITLSANKTIINVPSASMTPSVYILSEEQYPIQNYTYLLEVFSPFPDSTLIAGITGNFTIIQVNPGTI
jgi:hypothetical protein